MNSPLVSIIMSVYNNETSLSECLQSVLNQRYINFELLIVDDASTDNTKTILKQLNDERVKIYYNKKNLGLTNNLNILLEKSRGQLIARQDGDDLSNASRLVKQVKFLNENNLDACTTRAIIKNSTKLIPRFSHLIPPKLTVRYKNPFIHGTLLIKTHVINEIGRYDENFKYAQDYKLFIDLLTKGYKVKILNEALYTLNMDNNISTKYKNEQNYFAKLAKKSI